MIEISLFGATEVTAGAGRRVPVPLTGVKPRQILAVLAAALGSPVSKDELAERLWDGRPPASYVASVESYVCVLRRSLPCRPEAPALLTTRRGYLLDPQLVRVDLVEVAHQLTSLERATGEALVAGAECALAEVSGTVLADEPYADWAATLRRRFEELVESVATQAAEECLARGDAGRAVRLARRAAEHGPFSEPACRALMRAYDAVGSRPQALQAYADLRSVMTEELGVEPSSATQGVYLAVLGQERSVQHRDADRLEVPTLVRLLVQAFEDGVRMDPATRSGLATLERLLVRTGVAG
jgi:DNA-binding SARP family transcriptional activator